VMDEKRKIGRNDPCPCGSGKKYKNCCYPDKTQAWKKAGSHESPAFTIKPKEMPEPITHHLVSSDSGKTYESRPGLLAAQIIVRKPEDTDETISKIMESVSREINTLNLSESAKQEFKERINDVDHKLYAVKYHLSNYEQAESDKIKGFSKNYTPPLGYRKSLRNQGLFMKLKLSFSKRKVAWMCCRECLSQLSVSRVVVSATKETKLSTG
jgi:hypothetical protein